MVTSWKMDHEWVDVFPIDHRGNVPSQPLGRQYHQHWMHHFGTADFYFDHQSLMVKQNEDGWWYYCLSWRCKDHSFPVISPDIDMGKIEMEFLWWHVESFHRHQIAGIMEGFVRWDTPWKVNRWNISSWRWMVQIIFLKQTGWFVGEPAVKIFQGVRHEKFFFTNLELVLELPAELSNESLEKGTIFPEEIHQLIHGNSMIILVFRGCHCCLSWWASLGHNLGNIWGTQPWHSSLKGVASWYFSLQKIKFLGLRSPSRWIIQGWAIIGSMHSSNLDLLAAQSCFTRMMLSMR